MNNELDILFISKAKHVDKEDIERYSRRNSKRHRRRFLSYVSKGLVDKVSKYCDNGFDPNFRDDNGGKVKNLIVSEVS